MKTQFIACVLLGIAGLTAGSSVAQLTNVASDSFSYSAGTLAGQSGGSGWTGAWINDYGPGVSLSVSSTGMSYPGLATSGGNLVWVSGGVGISEDSRTLPLLNSGIVYVQFLSQFDSSSGGGTPNVRLLNSGALTGGFGGNGGSFGGDMSILDSTLNPASDGSSSSSSSLSGLNLVIARIDYQNNSTKMWVNPNLSTFDYLSPPAPNATYSGLAPVFNQIAIYSRSPDKFDELLIMAGPVPEPALPTLLAIGAGVLLAKRARRAGGQN